MHNFLKSINPLSLIPLSTILASSIASILGGPYSNLADDKGNSSAVVIRVPSSSWWRGVVTTSSSPGNNWTGQKLAGSSSGYFLQLNDGNGALSGADTLYCNLKIIIPASATAGGSANPVFVVKWTSN